MWGDNGITNKRVLRDQSITIASWGSTFQRLSTRAFNQVGYMRRVVIDIPITAGNIATVPTNNPLLANDNASIAAGSNAFNTPAFSDNVGYSAIQSLDVTAQGIAPLYQLGKGRDLAFLSFVRNGRNSVNVDPLGLVANANVGVASQGTSLLKPGADWNSVFFTVGAAASGAGVTQNVQYKGTFDLPLTEWVRFPATTVQGQNGPVAVAAQDVEVGLLTLQNTQQNVVAHATLNPLYSNTADSPFIQQTGAYAGGIPATVDLWTEFYDVPANPADQPPPYSQMFVITRTSVDDPVSGAAATHNFQPAGLLMRAIYCFYDTNGHLVDVSNQGRQTIPTTLSPSAQLNVGQITFKWGASVLKYQESFPVNLMRAAGIYGDVPPVGCLIHDFFEDHTLTNLINTATLTSVQTQVTGLPSNVTNMHVIEERMIPVRLG